MLITSLTVKVRSSNNTDPKIDHDQSSNERRSLWITDNSDIPADFGTATATFCCDTSTSSDQIIDFCSIANSNGIACPPDESNDDPAICVFASSLDGGTPPFYYLEIYASGGNEVTKGYVDSSDTSGGKRKYSLMIFCRISIP